LTMLRLSGDILQLGRGARVGNRSNNKFKEDIWRTLNRGLLEESCIELAESGATSPNHNIICHDNIPPRTNVSSLVCAVPLLSSAGLNPTFNIPLNCLLQDLPRQQCWSFAVGLGVTDSAPRPCIDGQRGRDAQRSSSRPHLYTSPEKRKRSPCKRT
jgi:hypothetical protein